jgi:methionine-gamma-lyase
MAHPHFVSVPRPVIPAVYPSAGGRYTSLDEYLLALSDATIGGQSMGCPPLANPINTMLESRLALLEKAEKAVAVNNGMAAIAATFLEFVHYGEYVVAHHIVSGLSEILLAEYLPTFGIRVERADFKDMEAVRKAINSQTKVVFLEVPSQPFLEIFDIASFADLAHKVGALLVVDHSLASPALLQPLTLGADMVVGSLSHYLTGSNDSHIGYIAGTREHVAEVANYAWVMGHNLNSRHASALLHNLPTFELRMARHCQNGMEIARFLHAHPKIQRLSYPGLHAHPDYDLARKQMKHFGGTVTCWLKSDMDGVMRFLNNLRVCYISPNFGDLFTSLEHTSSMGYLGVSPKKKTSLGISENLVRLSAGFDEADTVLRDLDQSLRKM